MAFDGLAVSCMVHELNDILTNGRVDKVLQPEYDEIILGVRAGGKNRRQDEVDCDQTGSFRRKEQHNL